MKDERNINFYAQKDCDVLVVGAGIAGASAALAAARNGKKVFLIEREYTVGGMATLGLISIYLPLCDGRGRQVSYGISEELLRLSVKHGADGPLPDAWMGGDNREARKKQRYKVQFYPCMFALLLEELLKKEGERIFYGTLATDVICCQNRITAVIAETKSGRYKIRASSVIDCTGDSDICMRAGAETNIYPAGNGLASWYYYHKDGEVKLRMFGLADTTPDCKNQEQESEKEASISSFRFRGTDSEERNAAWLMAHQKMLEDIEKHQKEDPSYMPMAISAIPLVRMSRRLAGRETLQKEGFYESSIGMCGDWCRSGPVYEIPFGALSSISFCNLLAAGRNISVENDLWNITRVIPPCAVTGEAAGTAAALTDDFWNLDTGLLQKKLRSQGVRIHRNEL